MPEELEELIEKIAKITKKSLNAALNSQPTIFIIAGKNFGDPYAIQVELFYAPSKRESHFIKTEGVLPHLLKFELVCNTGEKRKYEYLGSINIINSKRKELKSFCGHYWGQIKNKILSIKNESKSM